MTHAHAILFVDDDANILEAVQRSLRRHFRIDVASSAAEALTKMETTGPYAVIVTDMHMPLMSGVDLLRETESLAPDTVRIMMSGNLDRRAALEAFNQCRLFRLLTKPCSPLALLQAVEAGLKLYEAVKGPTPRGVPSFDDQRLSA